LIFQGRGWTRIPPESPGEVGVYRNPDLPHNLAPVDPRWEFREGDSIFNILCDDLGVSPEEFLDLLGTPEYHAGN
jgi:hypothetical protein